MSQTEGRATRHAAGPPLLHLVPRERTVGSPADLAGPPDYRGAVFDIVGRPTRGVTWAWARDDLDLATVTTAERELTSFLAEAETPGCVLIYLGADRFVDLRGLRLLVGLGTRLRGVGGELAVVAPPRSLRLLIEVVGLDGELPLLPTARHARRWARARER